MAVKGVFIQSIVLSHFHKRSQKINILPFFFHLCFLFFNGHTLETYGSSQARDRIQATVTFATGSAVATLDPFNPLRQARDQTHTARHTQDP